MSDFIFSLSDSIRGQIEEAARDEGITLKREASLGTQEDWDHVMSRVPARPPLPGDELPAGC